MLGSIESGTFDMNANEYLKSMFLIKNCYFYCQWYTCKDVTSLNNTQFCAHLREFSKGCGGPLLQALPYIIYKYNKIARWKSAMTFNNFTPFFFYIHTFHIVIKETIYFHCEIFEHVIYHYQHATLYYLFYLYLMHCKSL